MTIDNTLAFETLSEFRRYGYGLITPEGEVIPVTFMGHFDGLKRDERLAQEINEFEDMLSEEADEHVRYLREDEHPEWHLYEMWADGEKDRFRTEILEKAYSLGWGRLGKFDYWDGQCKFVELEASKEHINKLKKIAEELAEMLDYGLKITVR